MGEGESIEKFDEMTTLPTKESIVTTGDDSSINIVAHMKAFEDDLERNLQAIEARYEAFLRKQQKFSIQIDNKVKQLQRIVVHFLLLSVKTVIPKSSKDHFKRGWREP